MLTGFCLTLVDAICPLASHALLCIFSFLYKPNESPSGNPSAFCIEAFSEKERELDISSSLLRKVSFPFKKEKKKLSAVAFKLSQSKVCI